MKSLRFKNYIPGTAVLIFLSGFHIPVLFSEPAKEQTGPGLRSVIKTWSQEPFEQIFHAGRPPFETIPGSFASTGPVNLIFSSHASREDGLWSARQIRGILAKAVPGEPAVVWIEHAYPAGLPMTVAELERRFPLNAEKTSWYETLISGDMPAKQKTFLRLIFESALRSEGAGEEMFWNSTDPFYREIRKALEGLRRFGWNLKVQTEIPVFEAYLEDLKRDALGVAALEWLHRGERDQALLSLGLAYQACARSLALRDEALGLRIAKVRSRDARTRSIVVRGLAHEQPLGAFFKNAGIAFRSALQGAGNQSVLPGAEPDLKIYLLTHRKLPELGDPAGFQFLQAKLASLKAEGS